MLAVASLGGSLFLAHERTVRPAEALSDAANGFGSVDFQALLAAGMGRGDQAMLDSAFRRVERNYYKPVNAQTLLTGEQRELVAYLKKHAIADPQIPLLIATGDQRRDVAALNRDLALAQQRYGRRTSSAELTQAAIRGMLSSLGDPYTTYLSPTEINSLEESLRGGDFGGIGVYMVQDPASKAILVEPIDGMPAYQAGVRTADRIVSVDGVPVGPMKMDEVERLIRGRTGTLVHIGFSRRGVPHPHVVAIMRRQIVVPSVHARLDNGIEYIALTDFGATSYDEVRQALLHGKMHDARGYILDLRDNGGGYLDAAVNISSLFIPQGTIVSTIDRLGDRDTKAADSGDSSYVGAKPLVVLVNRFTASASEITAGAIQDYKAGTLIGTKTFGKGVVQSIYKTMDGGALKITTAKYVTPNGRDIQHKGIEPDVVIDQPADLILGSPHDRQLSAAKAFLRRTAKR